MKITGITVSRDTRWFCLIPLYIILKPQPEFSSGSEWFEYHLLLLLTSHLFPTQTFKTLINTELFAILLVDK